MAINFVLHIMGFLSASTARFVHTHLYSFSREPAGRPASIVRTLRSIVRTLRLSRNTIGRPEFKLPSDDFRSWVFQTPHKKNQSVFLPLFLLHVLAAVMSDFGTNDFGCHLYNEKFADDLQRYQRSIFVSDVGSLLPALQPLHRLMRC